MTGLPPLNALRAFEAAARTGSFTAAGAELGVTSAAVSQQVRNLETYWGKTLFIRQGNRLALSEAGLAAYPALARAMSTLAELSDMMQGAPRRLRLVLSAPHSVAETWLSSRLALGLAATRETAKSVDGAGGHRLEVRIEDDPVEFTRDGAHMRIFYGHGLYREYRVETLFEDRLVAVASPDFIARHGTKVARIADRFLIHTQWGPDYATSPNWSDHMPEQRDIGTTAGLRMVASSTALAFARKGLGAALVPLMMAQDDLALHRLKRLDAPDLTMPHPYSIAFPHALQNRPDVMEILRALLGEGVGASGHSVPRP